MLSFSLLPVPKRFGIAGEFLPTSFTLTSSLPRNRANISIFYDGPADTWMGGLDVGAVVHWIAQYEDDNVYSGRNLRRRNTQAANAENGPYHWFGRCTCAESYGLDDARPDPELYV